jgi:PAS domain-containing protein
MSVFFDFLNFPGAVLVCDSDGTLTHMNPAAESLFADRGGCALIGTNILDCHPPRAQEKIRALMRSRKSNVYTVEKAGVKRLICQSPWYQDGEYSGLIEVSFEIPHTIPHFVRK